MPKPETHGIFKDTKDVREREQMGSQMHFLDARMVGMPEAAHRTWGFHMRSGAGVTHLCTKPPHLRMRALARAPKELEQDHDDGSDDDDAGGGGGGGWQGESDDSDDGAASDEEADPADADSPLKFEDGTIEQYENRPQDGGSGECSARDRPGGSTGSPSREAATPMRIFVHTGLVTI